MVQRTLKPPSLTSPPFKSPSVSRIAQQNSQYPLDIMGPGFLLSCCSSTCHCGYLSGLIWVLSVVRAKEKVQGKCQNLQTSLRLPSLRTQSPGHRSAGKAGPCCLCWSPVRRREEGILEENSQVLPPWPCCSRTSLLSFCLWLLLHGPLDTLSMALPSCSEQFQLFFLISFLLKLFYCYFYFSETGPCSVVQADLELESLTLSLLIIKIQAVITSPSFLVPSFGI